MRPRFVCLITGASLRGIEAIEEVTDRLCVATEGQVPSEVEPPDDGADEEIPQSDGGSKYLEQKLPALSATHLSASGARG